jgi:hypothetical protein
LPVQYGVTPGTEHQHYLVRSPPWTLLGGSTSLYHSWGCRLREGNSVSQTPTVLQLRLAQLDTNVGFPFHSSVQGIQAWILEENRFKVFEPQTQPTPVVRQINRKIEHSQSAAFSQVTQIVLAVRMCHQQPADAPEANTPPTDHTPWQKLSICLCVCAGHCFF